MISNGSGDYMHMIEEEITKKRSDERKSYQEFVKTLSGRMWFDNTSTLNFTVR